MSRENGMPNYDADMDRRMEAHFFPPEPDDLTYDDQLVVAVENVMQMQERHLKALRAIANNLACAMELNGLNGKDSLRQQLLAHDLPLED